MKLKAMRNYEELRQVEKDHGKMMDEFIESAKEARALLDQGTDDSPKARATTISLVKGKITSFQRYRVVLQNKAVLEGGKGHDQADPGLRSPQR